jgi:hypothetical protein
LTTCSLATLKLTLSEIGRLKADALRDACACSERL